MRKIVVSLLLSSIPFLFVLACSKAIRDEAPPDIGLSLFGALSPNMQHLTPHLLKLNSFKLAILWRSFGEDPAFLDEWLSTTPELKTVEVHLSNEAGRRNNRLGESDLLPHMGVNQFNHALEYHTHDIDIRIWIAELTRFAITRPTHWILSLGLESNYTPLAAMNLLRLALEEWPYEIAYNPINSNDCGYMPDELYCETHSYAATPERPRCILNADGQDAGPGAIVSAGNQPASLQEVLDFVRRGRAANCHTFLWISSLQGIPSAVARPFTPTLERTFSLSDAAAIFLDEIINGSTD